MNAQDKTLTPSATSAADAVFALPAFQVDSADKSALLLEALNESYRHHMAACPAYARICNGRGLAADHVFERFEDFPYLPVQAFKEFADEFRSVSEDRVRTRISSSATSGRPSTVTIDAITARRQVQALTSVLSSTLGGKRRPFIICDVDPSEAAPGSLGARAAATRGFLNLAREAHYVLRIGEGGRLEVMHDKLTELLHRFAEAGEPFAIFGFTYVMFESVMEPLLGGAPAAPSNAHLLHIGGWKKLEDRKISREAFEAAALRVLGVPRERIVDFYGFTEQMGVVYPAAGGARRTIPAFAEVIVRDPDTHAPLPAGRPGLLQFLTPLPHSYPGFSVLTDDIGVLDETAGGERTFRVLGRARNAEVRGCGDIMGEKMVSRSATRSVLVDQPEVGAARLLFHGKSYVDTSDPARPVDLGALPEVSDMEALARELRQGRTVLDTYSYDELGMILAAAANRWVEPDSSLSVLLHQGLFFLKRWCEPDRLSRLGDEALNGSRGFMDSFRPVGGGGRLIRAYPRGLVGHWLSGNVPLLGMLAVTQAVLTRNANLLKSASTFSSALPSLLETFRGLTVEAPSGRLLKGDDILRSIAVVYYPRDNKVAAEAMSTAVDVRVAWGGRDAVEAIGQLPRRYDAEDVMFGPKLSYMAIGREALGDERLALKLARKAATDSSVFDQYACASPHTIYVERGAPIAPAEFAELLARQMGAAAVRIPKGQVDAATSARIMTQRLRHELTDQVWSSAGTTWTVIFQESHEPRLADPTYSRVITVRAVDDILATADLASEDIQTVGLGLSPERRQVYADRAARAGAYRFPDIGRMTEFDTVWDGVYMMNRFVKWVSLGGPAA